MREIKWVGLSAVILLLVWGYAAFADAQTKNPCADDIATFCKEVTPGGGRLAKCLKEHESELSPSCKESIAETKAALKDAHEACADDVQKFCKDVKPGRGRIVKCLKENEGNLSPECQEKIKAGRKKAE